jgi:L-alanine-DL-glutamate epimerase-like enolase superfamily enzyme
VNPADRIAPPRVASVEAWLVPLALERQIRFEQSGWWTHWRYVVVRVRAEDGREAASYAFIGEIPLDVMVTELIAPNVVGLAIDDLHAIGERCAGAAGPSLVDTVRPAAALVEMCLWDLAAQDARVPLWRLLCTEPARERARVMHVEHRRDDDTPETFAERVAAMAAEGVRAVKIKHYKDVGETATRLAAIRAAVPGELEIVVDPAWLWSDLDTAIAAARAWEPYELAWIEDPFPPHRVDEAAALRAAVRTPIGVGDLVTSVDLAERLIRGGAVDVLRVDATTMGGYAGVARLTALAASAGVDVSPELLAEQHQHLAFAAPAARWVEVYSPDSGIWSAGAIVRPGALTFADAGHIVAPEQPGSGLELDWEAVEHHAVRASRHSVGATA